MNIIDYNSTRVHDIIQDVIIYQVIIHPPVPTLNMVGIIFFII